MIFDRSEFGEKIIIIDKIVLSPGLFLNLYLSLSYDWSLFLLMSKRIMLLIENWS
ncbi:hypothetical protein IFVP408_C130113 [Vibrio parahaemolyticus]